jgi:hypothetical protein
VLAAEVQDFLSVAQSLQASLSFDIMPTLHQVRGRWAGARGEARRPGHGLRGKSRRPSEPGSAAACSRSLAASTSCKHSQTRPAPPLRRRCWCATASRPRASPGPRPRRRPGSRRWAAAALLTLPSCALLRPALPLRPLPC